MCFDCDQCGKNEVSKPGAWCNECQEKELYAQQASDELFYSLMAKCLNCGCLEGLEECSEYRGMPLYFFRRQKYCKNFMPIDQNYSRW